MIFNLLYSSSLLSGNKNRNIFLYAIGSLIYVVLHWILFSDLGARIPYSDKVRNIIYLIFIGDTIMTLKAYQKSKQEAKDFERASCSRHTPTFEEMPEEEMEQNYQRHRQLQNQPHMSQEEQQMHEARMCVNGQCQLPKESQSKKQQEEPEQQPEDKESTEEIPEYKPEKQEEIQPTPTPEEPEIPVYETKKEPIEQLG